MIKKKILVWLSGGVDSAVAASLLLQQGHDVTAGFMINYITDDETCTTKADLEEAKKVAEFLGIKLFTFDFTKEYEERIVNYIFEGYRQGITPNPDVLCNSDIKFRLFLDEARSLGFDAIATGHYARIQHDEDGTAHLLKGVDTNKDQSYFLSRLTQDQLAASIFPLGDMPKTEVRRIAKELGLPNAERKDSQWICFIGKVDLYEFLKTKIPPQEGNIVDTNGKVLGTHQGAFAFTIGQRQGIGVAYSEPLFVVKKDMTKNEIVVATASDAALYQSELYATQWQRIGETPPLPYEASAKIRYRQDDQACTVIEDESNPGNMKVVFSEPQRAVSSGQIVAIYNGDELMWSGLIQ